VQKTHLEANLYGLDNQFLGGTNVFCLLLEKPEFYGLPAKPQIPAITSWWKDVIQPVGKVMPLAVLGAIAGSVVMNRVNRRKPDNARHEHNEGGNTSG